jgi:hypothetical protein
VPVDRALELLGVIKVDGTAFSMDCAAIHELLK